MICCLNFDTDALQISDCFPAYAVWRNRFLGSLNGYKFGSENVTKIIKPSSYTKLVIWVLMSVLWTTNGLCHQTRLFCFCFVGLSILKCICNLHRKVTITEGHLTNCSKVRHTTCCKAKYFAAKKYV
jgi:hypothetical protein